MFLIAKIKPLLGLEDLCLTQFGALLLGYTSFFMGHEAQTLVRNGLFHFGLLS